MLSRRRQNGLTLLELIITISIGAILVSISSGNWTRATEKFLAAQVNSNVRLLFHQARQYAVLNRTIITICPLGQNNHCTSDWNRPVSIFSDPDSAKKLTSKDKLLRVLELSSKGDLASSSVGHGNRRYFQYTPDGSVNGSIGHLIWCPPSRNNRSAVQARINFGGRLRWASDRDKDGIVEDSSGQPITC